MKDSWVGMFAFAAIRVDIRRGLETVFDATWPLATIQSERRVLIGLHYGETTASFNRSDVLETAGWVGSAESRRAWAFRLISFALRVQRTI